MLQKRTSGRYLSIFSDGSLREKTTKDNPDAVLREYELKDGTKGEKWEVVYKSIIGRITGISFRDGDYGQQLILEFTGKEGDVLNVTTNTSSNFGTDIMRRLPNVDLSKSVFFLPYSFEDDRGKDRRGVSIKIGDEKAENFFFDPVNKKTVNGFPEPTKEDMDKDDWKVHFIEVKKFLVDYTEKNIIPKLEVKSNDIRESGDYPTAEDEGINPDDVPF